MAKLDVNRPESFNPLIDKNGYLILGTIMLSLELLNYIILGLGRLLFE